MGSVGVILEPAPGLRIRQWEDDLAVVYAPDSATTHLISSAAAELLRNGALQGRANVFDSAEAGSRADEAAGWSMSDDASARDATIGMLVAAGLLLRTSSPCS